MTADENVEQRGVEPIWIIGNFLDLKTPLYIEIIADIASARFVGKMLPADAAKRVRRLPSSSRP